MKAGTGNDRGAAMVTVLGIMLVGAVVTTTIVMMTMYNANLTAETREQLAARQSADGGIDLIASQLAGKAYKDLGLVCGDTFTINNDEVVVTTEYTIAGSGTTTPCPGPTDIITSLRVMSTATTAPLMGDGEPVVQTVVATFMPTPPEMLLDKAVFTEGHSTITNNSEFHASGAQDDDGNPIYDAHIYSNGGLDCKTQNVIEGSIVAAHGPISFPNNCTIYSSVWSSETVKFSSQARIYGDVYAASDATWGVEVENNPYIEGAVFTNGGVKTAAKKNSGPGGAGIRGSVFARTGEIELVNDAYIGGSAYAGRGIKMGNGGEIGGDAYATGGDIGNNRGTVGRHIRATGNVSSQVVSSAGHPASSGLASLGFPPTTYHPAGVEDFDIPVGYPGKIQPPTREQMPMMTMHDDESKLLWEQAGYTIQEVVGVCSGTGPAQVLNGTHPQAPDIGGARLIYFTGCSEPVTFTLHASIHLTGSVAIVSDTGFSTDNSFKVTTNSTGDPYKFHWIVPADAPGVTWVQAPNHDTQLTPVCADSETGRIYMRTNVELHTVESMAYTPCHFKQKTSWNHPWVGQIYAGQTTLQNGFALTMRTVPVPSLSDAEASPESEADLNILARFDYHG